MIVPLPLRPSRFTLSALRMAAETTLSNYSEVRQRSALDRMLVDIAGTRPAVCCSDADEGDERDQT